MIVDGDEVDEESCATDEGGEEKGRHQHLPDPYLAAIHIQMIVSKVVCFFLVIIFL